MDERILIHPARLAELESYTEDAMNWRKAVSGTEAYESRRDYQEGVLEASEPVSE